MIRLHECMARGQTLRAPSDRKLWKVIIVHVLKGHVHRKGTIKAIGDISILNI